MSTDLREEHGVRAAGEPVAHAPGGRPAPGKRRPLTPVGWMALLVAALVVAGSLTLVATREASPPPGMSPAVAPGVDDTVATDVPRVLSAQEVKFLVRHGATGTEIEAENLRAWHRVESRMLADPWVIGTLRHHDGTTEDLYRAWLSR